MRMKKRPKTRLMPRQERFNIDIIHIETNKEPFRQKIADAQRQRSEAKDHLVLQCIPVLEEKVTQLMLQLTGEAAFEENSTSNVSAAAVPGTTNPKTLKHSESSQSDDRKPPAKR